MKVSRIIAGLILIPMVCVIVVVSQVSSFMATPMRVADGGVPFEIPAGSSFASVSKKLVAGGLMDNDRWFRLYVRWHDKGGAIQAGDYLIAEGTTPLALLDQFTNGSVRLYAFTLIEGWNYREVLAALHDNDAIRVTG